MSKLPSFSTTFEFWKKAMLARLPATKETARKHQASLAEFHNERTTYYTFTQQRQHVLWNDIDTANPSDDSENSDDVPLDIPQGLDEDITLEDPLQDLNKKLTDGEPSTETISKRAFVSTQVFLSLAMSHWVLKAPELLSSRFISFLWLSPDSIIATFCRRRDCLWLYQKYGRIKSQPTAHELLLDAPDVWSTLIDNISREKGPNFLTENDIQTAMREGKRWQSLIDIFGPEIILVDNRFQALEIPELIPSFNIPKFIKDASHEAFSQGKDMISKCEWLKDTCRQLNGLCKQIETWLATDNEDLSLSIGEDIQARVQKILRYPRGTKLTTSQTDRIDQKPPIPEQFDGLFSDERLDRIPREKRWETIVAMSLAQFLVQREVAEEKKAAQNEVLEAVYMILANAPKGRTAAFEEWSVKLLDFIMDNPSTWSVRNLIAALRIPEQIEHFFHPSGVL